MRIGSNEVVLPSEDPLSAAPNWRRQAAEALAGMSRKGRIPGSLDDTVKDHLRFLRASARTKCTDSMTRHERVIRWADGDRGVLVKAHLLAGLSDEETTTQLGVELGDVELFRLLIFDVIDDEGKLRPGMRQDVDAEIIELAPDHQVMMRAALLGGADLLRLVTSSGNVEPDGHGSHLQHAVERELIVRVLRGEASNSDLARLANHDIARRRMLYETGQSSDSRSMEITKLALELVGMTKPRMVTPDLTTDEEQAVANEAIRAKLASDQQIGQHPLEQTGEGETAINEMLQTRTTTV